MENWKRILANRPKPCLDESVEKYVNGFLKRLPKPEKLPDEGEHYVTTFDCSRVNNNTGETCGRTCELYVNSAGGQINYRTDCQGNCLKKQSRT